MNEGHRMLAAAVVDELRQNNKLNDELVHFLKEMYPKIERCSVKSQKTKRMMNDAGLRTSSERQKKQQIMVNAYEADAHGSSSGARLENITLSGKGETESGRRGSEVESHYNLKLHASPEDAST